MADVHEREPCPHRILDDTGSAFALGCVGGSLFHLFKGARNSPRNERMLGAITAVQGNARRLGGSFAMWGGVFSSIDCLLIYYRQKDDPANAVVAGAVTGGILAIRGGLSVAFKNAVIGGVILLLIEGVSVIVTSVSMRQQYKMMEMM